MNIIYTYKKTNSNFWNQELRYSLRSLEQNLSEKFFVTVIGDYEEWFSKEINFIHKPVKIRNQNSTINKNIDLNLKIFKACEMFNEFLLFSDDMYLLRPFLFYEFTEIKILQDLNVINEPYKKRKWLEFLWNTFHKCKEYDLHGWNCETHTPLYVQSALAINTFNKFNLIGEELFWTSYGNEYLKINNQLPKKVNKNGFYNTNNIPILNADFLSHDDRGLSNELMCLIEEKFPNKSRFEK